MLSRRHFLNTALSGTASFALAPLITSITGSSAEAQPAQVASAAAMKNPDRSHFRLQMNSGTGGGPLGNGFIEIGEEQAFKALEGAWNAGSRYFDTSPFYGLTLSERRFGTFLHTKKRDEYILSTKVGRVFKAGKKVDKQGNWMNPSPFEYSYDYSAAGVRRSIEDSLQRLGIESIDIVYIHDLDPSNKELGANWTEHFEIARKGAMPELIKMRDEGLIKGWGLGVNEIEPIVKAIEVSDPDIVLCATQYSLMKHEDALEKLFPACMKNEVSVVVGAPLNAGFISGANRYDYAGTFPPGAKEKRSQMNAIARSFNVDLRTAGLQFCAAHPGVGAVIPGCRNATQATQNQESMKVKIPQEFWKKLKSARLISEKCPEPTA